MVIAGFIRHGTRGYSREHILPGFVSPALIPDVSLRSERLLED
jgi:hypothetical protein